MDLYTLHKAHVLTPWSAQAALNPPLIVRGEGAYLVDQEGKRYLDLTSGLVAVNLGHGHPRVVRAIQEQAQTLCYAPPSFFHDKRALLPGGFPSSPPGPRGPGSSSPPRGRRPTRTP
jgi:taurine--2-oxoglutarate transaminase